jgi:hypothetical protein
MVWAPSFGAFSLHVVCTACRMSRDIVTQAHLLSCPFEGPASELGYSYKRLQINLEFELLKLVSDPGTKFRPRCPAAEPTPEILAQVKQLEVSVEPLPRCYYM